MPSRFGLNAQAVGLIGDFWPIGSPKIPMVRNEGGVWEVFCSDAKKREILQIFGDTIMVIRLYRSSSYGWKTTQSLAPFRKELKDGLWRARQKFGSKERPVIIYEVHAGS